VLGGVAACAGCLIPLPLEQEHLPDAGEMLVVKGAQPAFGTLRPDIPQRAYQLGIDVVTENPNVAGRLYQQVNGTCCEIDLTKTDATFFLGNSSTSATSSPGRYSVNFSTVLPCQGQKGIIYLIPVIASNGFRNNMAIEPDGLGEIDRTHYWTIFCP
jgi:hypothetical protein